MAFPEFEMPESMFSVLLLEISLKPGSTAPPGPTPESFETKKGRLRVPRFKDPDPPTSDMIPSALQGKLVGYWKHGCIFRASDLIGMVSPQTAKITLDEIYDYHPRPLIDSQTIPEQERTLRNLYYISVMEDELPSFHFWKLSDSRKPDEAPKTSDSSQVSIRSELQGLGFSREKNALTASPDNVTTNTKPSEAHTQPNSGQGSPVVNGKNQHLQRGEEILQVLEHFKGHRNEIDGSASAQGTDVNQDINPPSSIHSSSGAPTLPLDLLAANLSVGDATNETEVSGSASGELSTRNSVPLHFQLGAMYLKDFASGSFRELARYLASEEEEELMSSKIFVDRWNLGAPEQKTCTVSSSRVATKDFHQHVKPYFGDKRYHFRIRSDAINEDASWDNSKPGSLKVTRVGVGHYYINAVGTGWNDPEQRSNNTTQFKKALDFLFGRDEPKPTRTTLQILPNPGPIDVDPMCDNFITSHLGDLIQNQITSSSISPSSLIPSVAARYSAEIFVHGPGEEFVHPGPQAPKSQEISRGKDKEKEGEHLPSQKQALDSENGEPQQMIEARIHTGSEVEGLAQISTTTGNATTPEVETLPAEHEKLYAALQSAIENQEGQITYLAKENNAMTNSLDEAKRSEASLIEESNGYKITIQNLQNRVHKFEKDWDSVKKLNKDYDELKVTALQYQKQIAKLEEDRKCDGQLKLECIKLRDKVQGFEKHIGELTKERDLSTASVKVLESQVQDLIEERNRLQEDVQHVTRQRSRETDHSSSTTQTQDHATISTTVKDDSAPTDKDEDEQNDKGSKTSNTVVAPVEPKNTPGSKHLLYCNVCLTSVDKLNQKAKAKHVESCRTNENSLLRLTVQEAKEMRQAKKGTSKVAKGSVNTGEPVPEAADTSDHEPASGAAEEATEVEKNEGQRKSSRKRTAKRRSPSNEPENISAQPSKKQKVSGKAASTEPKKTQAGRPRKALELPKDVIEADGESPPSTIGTFKRAGRNLGD